MPTVFLKSDPSKTASTGTLKLPTPEVTVEFRPHSGYKGEFGFDWMRMGDTTFFGDNKYEKIVCKQYKTAALENLEMDINEHEGEYEPDAAMYENLRKKYNPFSLPWSIKDEKGIESPEQYLTPWLSVFGKDKEAILAVKIDVNKKADFIQFENNDYYEITPKRIDIKGKLGKVDLSDNLTLKCIKEHNSDVEIVIKSFANENDRLGVLAGKIKAWANQKKKERKVVFIEVLTPELVDGKGERSKDTAPEKERVLSYIMQAMVNLHNDSKSIKLDLTDSTKNDLAKFIQDGAISYKATDDAQLKTFLLAQLEADPDHKGKYDTFFKAFYFGEEGRSETSGLNGYSQGSDFVCLFKNANDQTASHEFLHSMDLPHSFTNSEADSKATFTYTVKKTENLMDYSHQVEGHENSRCALWYWQWKTAFDSI